MNSLDIEHTLKCPKCTYVLVFTLRETNIDIKNKVVTIDCPQCLHTITL